MRTAALLVLLVGCDAVFKLPDPGEAGPRVKRIDPVTTINGDAFSIARPTEMEIDDLALFIVQNDVPNTSVGQLPTGASILTDFSSGDCGTVGWHVFFVQRRVADETAFDFRFNVPRAYAVMLLTLADVGSIELIRDIAPPTASDDRDVLLQPEPAPNGSLAMLGAVGDDSWSTDPPGFVREGALQNIAVFTRRVAGDGIPEVAIPIPLGYCAGVAEIRLEP